jgi:hypothetical protein
MKPVLKLITLLLFTGYTGIAQDLAFKIPEKAQAVASIKSDQLFQLLPINEFNASALGQRLFSELSKKTDGSYKSIEDLGFNLSSSIYYYNQKTDSISYHCLLVPISDVHKFEVLLNDTTRSHIKQQGDIKIIQTADSKSLLMWNKEMLFITFGSANSYFFNDLLTAARYGIKPPVESEEPYEEAIIDTTDDVMVDTIPAVEVDTAEATIMIDTPETEETVADIPESEESLAYKQLEKTKDSIVATWMVTYALDIFNTHNTSILDNPAYQRSIDKNAVASYWMANLQNVYASYLPYNYLKYANMMRGYGSVNASLYMDKEHMRITGEMALDADKADAYRKIYDKKLNKKFLKYVNSDSLIGFMSYAFDTESYLNELSHLFSQSFGSFSEEIDLGGDLLSLMLDEKAIAKVVKGDALILMTNLSQKETTYTTYVYDENYERKDTVQTKTETLPDILCMFSSDDTRLIEKLLKYGIGKGKIKLENNIYTLNRSTKIPFQLHLLIKDGIVFTATSHNDLEQINAGTFKGNVSKQQKELLMNNNMTVFVNPKNLRAKLPAEELGKMGKIFSNSGNWYLKSSGIKGNYISGEFVVDVPNDQENALKYFFSIFDEMENN